MIMVTIDDLQRMALELEFVNKALEKVSHYKVNRKIYELMKTVDCSDIVYHVKFDAMVLNGKPVFIYEDLEDGIAIYNHKESTDNKLTNLYSANMMDIRARLIRPIVFADTI